MLGHRVSRGTLALWALRDSKVHQETRAHPGLRVVQAWWATPGLLERWGPPGSQENQAPPENLGMLDRLA